MSVTISNKVYSSFGNMRFISFDLVVGAYTTGGVSLAASDLGLSSIALLMAERKAGVLYTYDYANSLIMAYRQSIATAGALSKPAITSTDGTLTVKGGVATGIGLVLDPDSDSGAMAMIAVTGPLVIPAATFGITKPSMALATQVLFTGDSNSAAAFAQTLNGSTLTDTVRCIVIGD
jgi:hypothetical protein